MVKRIYKRLNDLASNQTLHAHCMSCNLTGEALDTYKITQQLSENVSLRLIKKLCVCKKCRKKNEIVLCVKSHRMDPILKQSAAF